MNVLSISLLFVILFIATSGFSQSGTDYKTKIEALTREFAKNMVEGNMDKVLSIYTPDAISMPSYEPMQEGIAAIREASEKMAKSGMKYNSFELTTTESYGQR